MSTITPSATQDLARDGFTILPGVFAEEQLAPVRELTDRIISYAQKGLVDPFKPYLMSHRADQGALYDLCQRHPEFMDLARNPTVLDTLESVLGPDIYIYENTLVYKPKAKRNAVPWHQDFINRPHEPIKYIAWMALDDVTVENGAMRVIPGSHKLGFLPWHKVPGETHHTRVNLDNVDTSKFFWTTMNAGDVLIFHQLLLHSSEEVSPDKPRRAYRVSYQGFDQIVSPRGIPLVVRGGTPESLAHRFPTTQAEVAEPKPSLPRRIIHALARRMLKF